jgi:MFS family permease
LFWFAQMFSLVGSWMQMTGQQWLVLELTNDAGKLGLVSALQWLPVLVLSLFAGVIIDRLPKRRILIVTQSCLAAMAFVLAALTLTGRIHYWHILITASLIGTVQSFDMPTRQSFVVEMTGKEDLLNAIALNSSIFNLARFLGPALAGLVVTSFGTGWAFLLNGVSFFGVIYAFTVMKVPEQPRSKQKRDTLGEMQAGLKYIKNTPSILGLMTLLAVISIFALNFNILTPVLVRSVLHGDAGHYGLLMSCLGLGALAGSVSLATFGGRGPQMNAIRIGAIVLGLGEIALFFARGWTSAAILLFVSGLAMVTFSASSNTTIQVTVPDALRGRVMSVHALVFGGFTWFGALLAGFLAKTVGASASFAIIGSIAVITTLVMWATGRLPALRTALPATDPPASQATPIPGA